MLIALVRVVILIVAIITVSAACQLLTGASLHPQNEKQNNQIAETHRLWYLITSRQPMSLPCKDTFQMLCTDSLTCCWHLMLSSKIASPRATSAPLSICHYQILIPVLVMLNNRLIALPSPNLYHINVRVIYACTSFDDYTIEGPLTNHTPELEVTYWPAACHAIEQIWRYLQPKGTEVAIC